MNAFLDWLGPILAMCIGVMILAIFFNALAAVKNRLTPARSIRIKGFLNKADRVTLHLSRGEILEDVRFIGFLDTTSLKGAVPYQLSNMVILESQSGERILLRADNIRSIRQLNVEPCASASGDCATPAPRAELPSAS